MRTVSAIAKLALGKIGAFTVNMVAPDPDEMILTVEWMDILVAEFASIRRRYWLTPATVVKSLTASTASYTLSTLMGTSYPTDGILFPTGAFIRDTTGLDTPAQLISRAEYEDLENKSLTGIPDRVYIDRLVNGQKLYIYPVPTDSTYSVGLIVQTYTPSLIGGSPAKAGNIGHGFPPEWEKWLITATAAEIGDGPVRRLPVSEVDRFRRDAGVSAVQLDLYANTEKTTTQKRVRADI